MIAFMEPKEKLKDVEKCLDSQLWHACAGGMVQMPAVNSNVYYFPQGHAEHSCGTVDFRTLPPLPPYILSRVCAIKFMADPDTDEVFAKMKLAPVAAGDSPDFDDHDGLMNGSADGSDSKQAAAPTSFSKTLTQSDANNGGGFSVPRYCAETIFPRLDYSADPPVQTILAKDVHGETWKFRHIYRGTPRRHLLTTGWSTFVNHKKLVVGDSIVFLRAENGDLCVGIRRTKRGIGGGTESSWNPAGGNFVVPYGGFSDSKLNDGLMAKGKVRPESVVEAATRAANGQPFEVVYYPRANTPEFCVKSTLVKAALQIRWCSGMRFKMPFETEDSSRISWFMGTISSVQVADPIHWPDSPWRLLQVTWDEPDLLQNVKRVSPWLVELVSNMPPIHHHLLPPFSQPRKKLRLPVPYHYPDFNAHLGGCVAADRYHNTTPPAGMQGARHAHYGHLPLSPPPPPDHLHFTKLHTDGLLLPTRFPPSLSVQQQMVQMPCSMSESISCVLTMGKPNLQSNKSSEPKTTHQQLVLFGKPILTEQQISLSGSGDTTTTAAASPNQNPSLDGNAEPLLSDNRVEADETSHSECRLFLEPDDVGQVIDLSALGSYDELHNKLVEIFKFENRETTKIQSNVVYSDVVGVVRHIGDEPYSDFARSARKLTILTDLSSDDVGKKKQN